MFGGAIGVYPIVNRISWLSGGRSPDRQTYLVCATPRSGSTLLCEMLRGTGRAGRPLEHFEILRHSSLPRQPREYFHGVDAPHVIERLAPTDRGTPSRESPEEWWARVLRDGRTENGVWGGKLMWGHVTDLLARVRALPGMGDADLRMALQRLLGNPATVLVTRADKVAQAVSLWRALQTRSWRAGEPVSGGRPLYDFTAIEYLAGQLEREERAWVQWFRRNGGPSLQIPYEQLEREPQATASRVLSALGIRAAEPPEPPLAQQRDELSMAWIERFHGERRQAA